MAHFLHIEDVEGISFNSLSDSDKKKRLGCRNSGYKKIVREGVIKMRTHHLLLSLIAVTLMSCSSVEAKVYTTVVYDVGAGDTMDNIAQRYLPSDRGPSWRAFAEFKEGIFEYNYDKVFIQRRPYEVREGDRLLITFWQ